MSDKNINVSHYLYLHDLEVHLQFFKTSINTFLKLNCLCDVFVDIANKLKD